MDHRALAIGFLAHRSPLVGDPEVHARLVFGCYTHATHQLFVQARTPKGSGHVPDPRRSRVCRDVVKAKRRWTPPSATLPRRRAETTGRNNKTIGEIETGCRQRKEPSPSKRRQQTSPRNFSLLIRQQTPVLVTFTYTRRTGTYGRRNTTLLPARRFPQSSQTSQHAFRTSHMMRQTFLPNKHDRTN